jgi:hypothetical protein
MTRPADKPTDQTGREIKEILARVDRLPALDDRPTDEIVDYDENGIPSQPAFADRARRPVVPNAVEDFLKYRHREWES